MVWRPKWMGSSVKMLEKVFFLFYVFFAAFEEIFPSLHFLKRFMHTASESQHSNLWCHQDLLPGAAAWTTNQTLCIFIQCLLEISHTNKPPFAVALWVVIQECAPLSPENYPGWCLCHAFHFCVVILQGVHMHVVSLEVYRGAIWLR